MRRFKKWNRQIEIALTSEELAKVWELACIHSSDSEIAHSLDFTHQAWIVYRNNHPEVQEWVDKAKAYGAENLRKAQWASAMAGNVNMQIWLGRSVLGQGKDEIVETGRQFQLTDVSEEAKRNLVEIRNAIYGDPEPKEIELTDVKVESVDSDAEANN